MPEQKIITLHDVDIGSGLGIKSPFVKWGSIVAPNLPPSWALCHDESVVELPLHLAGTLILFLALVSFHPKQAGFLSQILLPTAAGFGLLYLKARKGAVGRGRH